MTDKITPEQFAVHLQTIAESYQLQVTKGLAAGFMMVCEDHTELEVRKAVKLLVSNHTHGKPKPGDLAKYLGRTEAAAKGNADAQAMAAWVAFEPKISRANTYPMKFADKTAAETITRTGGLTAYGSATDLTWLKKEFLDVYASLLASGVEHESGLLRPSRPMFDDDDARRVHAPYLQSGANDRNRLTAGDTDELAAR